MNWF